MNLQVGLFGTWMNPKWIETSYYHNLFKYSDHPPSIEGDMLQFDSIYPSLDSK